MVGVMYGMEERLEERYAAASRHVSTPPATSARLPPRQHASRHVSTPPATSARLPPPIHALTSRPALNRYSIHTCTHTLTQARTRACQDRRASKHARTQASKQACMQRQTDGRADRHKCINPVAVPLRGNKQGHLQRRQAPPAHPRRLPSERASKQAGKQARTHARTHARKQVKPRKVSSRHHATNCAADPWGRP